MFIDNTKKKFRIQCKTNYLDISATILNCLIMTKIYIMIKDVLELEDINLLVQQK